MAHPASINAAAVGAGASSVLAVTAFLIVTASPQLPGPTPDPRSRTSHSLSASPAPPGWPRGRQDLAAWPGDARHAGPGQS